MLYRTEDLARWGAGKGANLLPVEIDENNWEVEGRLQAVEAAAGEAANGIASISVTGSQMTVYLADGTPLGPFTLPTAMIRYRGEWAISTAYLEMDLVMVADVGIYLVLEDHTSDASAFDALAEDGEGNPLYRFLFPVSDRPSVSDEGTLVVATPTDLNFAGAGVSVANDGDGTVTITIPGGGGSAAAVSDEGTQVLVAPTDVNFAGAGVSVADDGDGTATVTIPGGGSTGVSDEGTQVLAGPSDINFAGAGVSVADDGDGTVTVTIPGGGGGGALGDLSDVTITTPASGQFLRYDGSAFVNAVVDWSDLANKPATFTPSAHNHPTSEIDGFAEAVQDAVGAMFVAGSNVTVTYDDGAGTLTIAASGGGGGGSAAVETIAGTTYTQVAGDAGKWKRTTSALATTITIDASINAADDEITFQQGAAGQITFVAGAGMTLHTSGSLTTDGEEAVVGIKFLSATEATLFGQTTPAAGDRRNLIINGNFDIWQRGTSLTAASSNRYLADRWLTAATISTVAPSRQSFTLGQTDVPGEPAYYHRAVVASSVGAAFYAVLRQKIEGVRTLAGRTVTFSFYAKADAPKNIAVEITQHFGTGGTPSSAVTGLGAQLVALTASWQRFEITIALPSISGKMLGSNGDDFLAPHFWFDAGSDWTARTASVGQQSGTFDIAQVQLELGPVATVFEKLPIAQVLTLCQRFYEKTRFVLASAAFGGGISVNHVQWSTKKRATPTLTLTPDTGTGASLVALNEHGFYQNAVHGAVSAASAFGDSEL